MEGRGGGRKEGGREGGKNAIEREVGGGREGQSH